MLHGLSHLLEALGPWLVFGLVFLESMGLPFPGETVLLTGAAFAAAGKLSIVEVYLGSAAGGALGAMAGYGIGRSGVLAWLRRRGATSGRIGGEKDSTSILEASGLSRYSMNSFAALGCFELFITADGASISRAPSFG